MSLPISETRKARKRKGDAPKVKLPTNMQSKNWPKCPNCTAPYQNHCKNCGYKRVAFELSKNGIDLYNLFQKASEV